jgi:tetratricopeptide (TPR) repeat protein
MQKMKDSAFDQLVDRGVAAHQNNRFEDALSAYRRALDLKPDDAEVMSLSGLALTYLGRLGEARPALEKAVLQEPDQAGFRLNLIECLEREKEFERAAKEIDTVLSLNARLPRAWEKKGDLSARQQAFKTAAHAYASASDLDKSNPTLALKLARARAAQREFADAHTALDLADALTPNHPAVLELRAAVLAEQRDWTTLDVVTRRWINLDPRNSVAWHSLTQATFEQGLYRQSLAAYERVLEYSGRNAANLAAFGRICLYASEFERAAAALDESERRNPNHVETLAAKGLLLAYRGQFDEALGYCRRCLQLDPSYAPAYTQLTRLTKGRLSAQEIRTLLGLVENKSNPVEDRILAYFALGHGLDAEGRYDDAFDAYAAANALQIEQNRAEGILYDARLAEARTDRIIQQFAEAAEGDLTPEGPTPVFIVGMPRSGTTLVESVLAAHSRLIAGGERPMMPQLLDRYLQLAESGKVTPENVRALARIYLDELPASDGFVTDKNPLNFESVGLIPILFPNAIVIHIRRDPLETGLSIFRHEFAKFWRFAHRLEDIGHYYGQYVRLVSHWERMFGERLITIQYEEFASEFAPAARELVQKCGLPWEDACEHFQQEAPTIATFSAVQAREPVVVRFGKAQSYAHHLGPIKRALGSVAQ